MLFVNDRIAVPLKEFEFSFSRSPGPGGQNVNKLNTKVTLRWNPDESAAIPSAVTNRFKKKYARRINNQGQLVITSHRFRDQGRNVADAINKLREMILQVADEPTIRKKTRPTAASRRRRLENKRRTSEKKRARRRPVDE